MNRTIICHLVAVWEAGVGFVLCFLALLHYRSIKGMREGSHGEDGVSLPDTGRRHLENPGGALVILWKWNDWR